MTRIRFRNASIWGWLFGACAFLALLPAAAMARPEIGPVSSGAVLALDVWTTRGEGAVYRSGDDIFVYFRATADCFVSIYDITTEGRTVLLFPQYPDDGFIRGGITYRLPGYYDGLPMRVSGPRGVEYIHAVASLEPGMFRFHTRGGAYSLEAEPISGDPFDAMNAINGRLIAPEYVRATSTTSFFIDAPVWYPRYYCRSCHAGTMIADPYAMECRRYVIRAHTTYDYWWEHDYHPMHRGVLFAGPFWFVEVRIGHVHRPHGIRYVDCAWGHANWYPMRPPARPWVHTEQHSPRLVRYREYERSYTPVTYRDERQRRDDRSRSGGPMRSGVDPRTRIGSGERDGQSRDAQIRVRDANVPSRDVQMRGDAQSRSREVQAQREAQAQRDAVLRREATPPRELNVPSRDVQMRGDAQSRSREVQAQREAQAQRDAVLRREATPPRELNVPSRGVQMRGDAQSRSREVQPQREAQAQRDAQVRSRNTDVRGDTDVRGAVDAGSHRRSRGR